MSDTDKKKLGLSGNALKIIGIIAMTIDHIAWMGIETYAQAETPMQIGLHIIGRLTAPIMCFFVAEGYYHTHDFKKYLVRVAVLAVVSHFAFCYFNMSDFNPFTNLIFNATSIAWPLMWGLILLKVWDMERFSVWLKVVITIAACILTATSDWSCAAPLAILLMGRFRGNFYKQMLYMMAVVTLYAIAFFIINNHIYGMIHMACWFTVPLLSLYNGERGKLKWLGKLFYWYYPVHMALIGLLARVIM
ncbi:TraX family protein [Butyrivibrio sp. YAB3001]|uniref:TraX family protein n=1 Tax=Butyrivibrio sp. YAB3001 TaxID=1520812 RepID=UPI0008F63A87|nr:TraX family protein [Butyrivibrio sp. YAB3001]SFC90019.1 TraX protein [Butyrivibrio sp. YAB3001]